MQRYFLLPDQNVTQTTRRPWRRALDGGSHRFGGKFDHEPRYPMVFGYDALHEQLVVGRPYENMVTLLKRQALQEWIRL